MGSMTSWAINAATAAEIDFAPIAQPCHRKTVSAADRKLIDRYIAATLADGKTVVVPQGVSGMDEQKDKEAADWLGSRAGTSPARRLQLSRRRQEYRALHDLKYDDEKIAKLMRVTVNTVKFHLRQMRLGQPRFCRDG